MICDDDNLRLERRPPRDSWRGLPLMPWTDSEERASGRVRCPETVVRRWCELMLSC